MSEQQPKPQATTDRISEAELRAVLAALSRADQAVRSHEEPRSGAVFERKFSHWQRLYRKALAMGGQIEAEDR